VLPWRLRPVRTLPAVAMSAVVRDGAGNLWIGTEAHGVYRLNGQRRDSLRAANGLASDAVEQLLLDAVQNLWVGTRQGVDLVELDELQERVLRIVHHGPNEGFIGIECFRNANLLDSDGALWFGTARGATRHDPRLAVAELREPSIHLTDLRLFFERPDWSAWSHGTDKRGIPAGLSLPHDQNHLTFHFTGISLAYPEKVRYHYYLEGLDPEWSPITAIDHVTYSALPPGDYTFHVQARAASGTWNEPPIAYAFTIRPAFWQTIAFRVAAVLVLLLGVLAFIRLRTRRLRRDRERLERTVQERTRELAHEKDRSEELLRNILPASTAEELKTKGHADARRYEHCTVLFSDFKGFTTFSSRMDSDTLVSELHHYFSLFDQLSAQHGLEKIKTIGDAYMCAAGLPEPSPTHALRALLMAFGMLDAVERSNAERRAKGLQEWPIRIGLHSGPVVAGVVGTRKFAYDIWGDTVNLASRMEANSEAGRINISGPVYAQVMEWIEAVPRGPIKVKGKGEVQMYFAVRLKKEHSADARGWIGKEALADAIGAQQP
jgi:class 3 adenylate cyclase